MPSPAAVRVHVGHDEEGGGGAGGPARGVGVVEQAAEEALGEVLGLGLARVLPRDDPDARASRLDGPDTDAVEVVAVEGLAELRREFF